MISIVDCTPRQMINIATLEGLDAPVEGALLFLDGQYLLRYRENGAYKSKFVTAQDVAAAFTGADLDTGWTPAGVLRQGNTHAGPFFVYSAPAQKVEIQFTNVDRTLTIPFPRTVLLGTDRTYYLWALRGQNFSPEDRVYEAPFPNVFPDGHICWGSSNTPPEADAHNARKTWELFFKLPFNGDLAAKKSQAHPKDVRQQLLALAENGAKSYPTDDLIPHDSAGRIGYTIDRILKG